MACLLALVIAAAVLTVPPGKLTAQAARTSPAEAFWRAAFPDTAMPEAIRELLHPAAAIAEANLPSNVNAGEGNEPPPLNFDYGDYRASPRNHVVAAAPSSKALGHAGAASPAVFFLEDAVREGESLALRRISWRAANADMPATAAATAPLQLYTVRAVWAVEGSIFVVCRRATSPAAAAAAVYRCRGAGPARAYVVDAVGERGDAVTAAVVCHTDTSRWDADHAAFRLLDVKPGGAAVCLAVPDAQIFPAKRKKSPSSA
ncbi:hypothetical protein ACP70R_007047 [Stipagrostis hirtigluma subsp. patula]